MNDHETASIDHTERSDVPTLTILPTPVVPPAESVDHRLLPDRTTKLVADVIGTTTRKATDILSALGGIQGVAYASEAALCNVAIPRSRARLVRAAFELARQSIGQPPGLGVRLAGASEVWTHMRARLAGRAVEEFWAIALDIRHRVIVDTLLARGGLSGVEIHPRDVFRVLIKAGSAAVLFCHNHPSGDPAPSRADIELTTRLREVGDLCGIPVLDHVVVGFGGYVSLAERNWR
jgi:DNA repair protein RadC